MLPANIHGQVAAKLQCVAPFDGDWKLDLLDPNDGKQSRLLKMRLGPLLNDLKIDTAAVFTPDIGSESEHVERAEHFTGLVELSEKIVVYTQSKELSFGVWLRPGHTVLMQGRGMPVIVGIGGDHCLVTPLSWQVLVTDEFDIFEKIANAFADRGVAKGSILLRGFYGLKPAGLAQLARAQPSDFSENVLRHLEETWGPNLTPNEPRVIGEHEGVRYFNPYGLIKARSRKARIISTSYDHMLDADDGFAHPGHSNPERAVQSNMFVIKRINPWQ